MCQKKLFFSFGTEYFRANDAKRFMKFSDGESKNFFPTKMCLSMGKLLTRDGSNQRNSKSPASSHF